MTIHTAAPLIRPDLLALKPVAHGSIAAAELAQFGLTLTDAIDFSVNTNPLGPAPSVLGAIDGTDWTRYPSDDETPLRNGLACQAGVLRSRWRLAMDPLSYSGGSHSPLSGRATE